MDATKQPGIRIGQIYLDAVHFLQRADAGVLPPDTKIGQMNIDVSIEIGTNEEHSKGMIAVTVNNSSAESIYQFTVKMVGLFDIDPAGENMNLLEFLKLSGTSLLYPFIRETVANITARGRFGPVWLKPFNVAAAFGPKDTEKKEPEEPK